MIRRNITIQAARRTVVAIASSRVDHHSQIILRRHLSTVCRATMFKNAVDTHASVELESQASHHSPPKSSQAFLQTSGALQPATLSQTNARKPFKPPTMNYGVKRTSSGLSKATRGSFEMENIDDDALLSVEVKNKKTQAKEVIFLDDFDSDIDLDIEPPKAITYPTLPPLPTPRGLPRALVSPTQPLQQQYQTAYIDLSNETNLLSSSVPAPWSSSPPQHLQPKHPILKSALESKPDVLEISQAAFAKRKLPWESAARKTAPAKAVAAATPASKTNRASEFLNNSASAVKEQQKKHREEARKVVKKEEDPAKSLLAVKNQKKRVPKVFLSEEQQHVLDLVVEQKESVFFTGSAGTGKSVLLREIIAALRKRYAREPDRIAVTASTGLAACNVGGVTLHSFAGIGLGKEEVPELVKKIKRNQKARHRWLRTKVLIVDEVSMVDGALFDKLEAVARQLRNNGRPFGGIQLVITGDFFQLPPVPDGGKPAKFSFDAATWNTVIRHTIGLHQVFRQKDPVFAGMLNEMREGRLSESSVKVFKNLDRKLTFEDNIEATALFPLRAEVDRANATKLNSLEGREFTFEARDGGAIADKVQRDKLLANCMAPAEIVLKKGAQVMLIKNVDETLVNGSIGTVIAFMDSTQFDRFTLDEDLYVQYENGVFTTQADQELSKEEKARKRLTDNLTTARQFPLVRFSIPDGTTRDMLCEPESWKIELPSGEIQASRMQIPLILSWALSIHKAQGQTLERVTVDLNKVFEKGQAYVALSRATSMSGLQVTGFDPRKVMAHDRVVQFYRNLARLKLEDDKSVKREDSKTDLDWMDSKPGVTNEKKPSIHNPSAYEKRFLNNEL